MWIVANMLSTKSKWVSLILCICAISIAPQARAEIRLGTSEWVGDVAWYIAQEKGFFKKNGVVVKLVHAASVEESFAQFDAGKIDANPQPWADTLVRISQNVPAKVILVEDYSAGADALMVTPAIKQLSDLKGKKIVLEEIAITQFLVETALSKADLTRKHVQFEFMPTSDAAKAFLAGKADAAAVWNPHVNEIQTSNLGRPLFSSRDIPGMIADVIVVNEQSLKHKRAEYLGLIRSWYDVVRFLKTNREEAIAIMAKAAKQDPIQYKLFVSGVQLLGQEENLRALGSSSTQGSLGNVSQPWIKFLRERKLANGRIAVDAAIDGSLVREIGRR